MTTGDDSDYGFFGWKEFRRNRGDLLAEFDRARTYNASRPLRTEHGNAGEAMLRSWLSKYLPGRYAVTSGYVIPDIVVPEYKLYHFDVIIYDFVNSPVLWIDGDYDTSDQGRKRAIPAKHVRSVFEVKASLTRSSASEAALKLTQLNGLTKYLPNGFSCSTFFYELDASSVENQSILPALIPSSTIVGYNGGVVLRCRLDDRMTGVIRLLPRPPNPEDAKDVPVALAKNLDVIGVHRDNKGDIVITEQGAGVTAFAGPDGWHFSKCYGPTVWGQAQGVMLNWSHNGFAQFALGLLERLEGIPETNRRTYVFGQIFDKIRAL